MTNGRDTERFRRVTAILLQWGSWAFCVGLGTWSILEFDPNHGYFAPQWVGLAFIFGLGVAISASVVRSRMRMTKAILGAFEAGRATAREEADARVNNAVNSAIVSLDRRITSNSAIIRDLQPKGDDD